MKNDENRAARNKAIAEYYTTKTNILKAQHDQILMENEKLKLELDKLKNK